MKKKKAVSKIARGKLAKSAVFKGNKDSKPEGYVGKLSGTESQVCVCLPLASFSLFNIDRGEPSSNLSLVVCGLV